MKINQLSIYETSTLKTFTKLITSTFNKFYDKENYNGFIETLKMNKDSPENKILEESYTNTKDVLNTVLSDIKSVINAWGEYEDYRNKRYTTLQKNNCVLHINNEEIEIPYFELVEIESHIQAIKVLVEQSPIIDTNDWGESSSRDNVYIQSKPSITPKIDDNDKTIIGAVTRINFSGALTEQTKTELINKLDNLIQQIKCSLVEKDNVKINDTKSLSKSIVNYLFGS